MTAQDGRQSKNDLDHVTRCVELPLMHEVLPESYSDVVGYKKWELSLMENSGKTD